MKLTVEGLSWRPVRQGPPVLDQVRLTLESGRFYGVLGPNGSGKTSLARHLLRLLPAPAGTVRLDGTDLNRLSPRQLAKIFAYMPQSGQIQADFTVREVVAMGRAPYRRAFGPLSPGDRAAVERAIALTGCEDIAEKSILKVSGGERQRALMARAVAQDTPWLVADEPIASLDVLYQTRLMRALGDLNRAGKTVLAIVHDVNLAARYCTDLILMKQGRVLAAGPVKDVLTLENLQTLYDIPFRAVTLAQGESWYLPL